MYRRDFWTLWEKARVGCFEGTTLKQVCYQGWNRSPAQVGCMRQVLRPGALGRPRGMGWGGRWEGGWGWGIHVNPWVIHVNVWQKPLQYCKVISLQLIKINGRRKTHAANRRVAESTVFFITTLNVHSNTTKKSDLWLWSCSPRAQFISSRESYFFFLTAITGSN